MKREYILTGGPGIGKTTLIEKLQDMGYETVRESARDIIEEELEKEKNDSSYTAIIPQNDLLTFQYLVMERMQQREAEPKVDEVFLDRSLPDNIGYSALGGIEHKIDWQIHALMKDKEYSKVFFLERLGNYKQDDERLEDNDFAQSLHDQMLNTYDKLGFDIVHVPSFNGIPKEESIQKRLDIILDNLDDGKKNRELEAKFKISNPIDIEKKLENFIVDKVAEVDEHNKVCEIFGLSEKHNYLFRLRNDGKYKFTFKTPIKDGPFNDRMEIEKEIPEGLYKILYKILPEKSTYKKHRKVYVPLGDQNCEICLDFVDGIGDFVEIEARSENQINLWKKRLGITSDNIKVPYFVLTGSK